jgi:hypothetical protein
MQKVLLKSKNIIWRRLWRTKECDYGKKGGKEQGHRSLKKYDFVSPSTTLRFYLPLRTVRCHVCRSAVEASQIITSPF